MTFRKIIKCPKCEYRFEVYSKEEKRSELVNKVVKCPICSSERTWKDGIRYTPGGEVQRYLCRNCGYRFSC